MKSFGIFSEVQQILCYLNNSVINGNRKESFRLMQNHLSCIAVCKVLLLSTTE